MRGAHHINKVVVILVTKLIAVYSCGAEPDFITSQGIKTYTNKTPITQSILEDASDFYVTKFSELTDTSPAQLYNYMKNLYVEWHLEPFPCWYLKNDKWVEGTCDGTQDWNYIRVAWKGSISDSAYFHELTHWVVQRITGIVDYEHKHRRFWDAESIVRAEYRRLIGQ